MAFQNSGKKRKRERRSNEFTCYKLRESSRPNTVTNRDGEARFWRVCVDCELDFRVEEWTNWPAESRAYRGTECIASECVFLDFKKQNKGRAWNQQGAGALLQAEEQNARDQAGQNSPAQRSASK